MRKNGLHIDTHGTKRWFKDGLMHRDDGPAAIHLGGTEFWYKEGKWHRDYGPAVIKADGSNLWYKDDLPYQPSAHDLMVWKMNERRTTC